MGIYAQLLQMLQNQGAGGTTGGLGTPAGGASMAPQIGVASGNMAPQLPSMQRLPTGAAGAANIPSAFGANGQMNGRPGQGADQGMAGIMGNPQYLQMLQKMQGGQGTGAPQGQGTGLGLLGQFGGMSGADANTLRNQLQGGNPNSEMISPQMSQFINGAAGSASGGMSPTMWQQIMQRLGIGGGGGTPQQ